MFPTADNPWHTEQGRLARAETFRGLAQGEGELAEFARDVVAGRATPRQLVTSTVLSDRFLDTIRTAVEKWHALPDTDRERFLTGADSAMRERVTQLAESAADHRPVRGRRGPEPRDEELFEEPVVLS